MSFAWFQYAQWIQLEILFGQIGALTSPLSAVVLPQHPGGCQREAGLEDLRRFRSDPRRRGSSPLRRRALDLELEQTVYALDSTTIELCLNLFPWAHFQEQSGAIKLHTLLDLRGNLPAYVWITKGKLHDVAQNVRTCLRERQCRKVQYPWGVPSFLVRLQQGCSAG